MPRIPDLPCADCGQMMQRSHTSAPEGAARCRACRRAVIPHGKVAGYKRGCRCDECRAAAAEAARAYSAKVKARDGLSPTQKARPASRKCCNDCGKALAGGWKSAAPRCIPCIDASRHARRRAAARRRRATAKLARAAAGVQANPRWSFVNGTCAYCVQPFIRRGQASSYCSVECKRKDKRGKFVTRRVRLGIYERDGWICQLCMEPVDPTLHYLNDWAPTLDHIECRSWTDKPDHSPENLRLAHRWCNSVRGDETHYSAVDLAAA